MRACVILSSESVLRQVYFESISSLRLNTVTRLSISQYVPRGSANIGLNAVKGRDPKQSSGMLTLLLDDASRKAL